MIAETEEELRTKLSKWKKGMEAKGLRVNVGKTKVMFSGRDLHSLTDLQCLQTRGGSQLDFLQWMFSLGSQEM